ncbi:SDR family NAD(P)-dependent oxidoreductase [Kouleothrix sp.]|uniref:polyketide synthase family protein n=1 Tax=Kouleothrix sp. TaxID=2779161 RepID=UPI00391974D2
MGRELYAGEPVFRAQIDRCAKLLRPHLGLDLRAVLYPPAEAGAAPLTRTSTALPALFAFEYALAQLWMAWGIQPQALLGHSLGEYVAACLAGVFSLEDALALVALRGRLFEQLPAGAMLSLPLAEAEVAPLLGGRLSIAATNAPEQCVVSGPAAAIDELAAALDARGQPFRRIPIDVAAHSVMVEPILGEFRAFVSRLRLRPPQIACVSNLTGGWLTPEDATDPEYWVRHLRHTVRFASGLATLLGDADRVLLEVGPGQALAGLARRSPARTTQVVLASLPREHAGERAGVLAALGQLWLAGLAPDWAGVHNGQRRRVALPTYPFERQRFWIDPPAAGATAAPAPRPKADIADWFAAPSWRRALPPEPIAHDERGWLIVGDDGGLGQQLADRLAQAGHACAVARPGAAFAQSGPQAYTLDPRDPAQYHALLGALRAAGGLPGTIVHMCSLAAGQAHALELGFYSLLWLAQALGDQPSAGPLRLVVVSNQLHEVTGDELLLPEQAALLGPCQAIPLEYPQIACWSVDVELFEPGDQRRERLLDQLVAELAGRSSDAPVAYRGAQRGVRALEPLRIGPAPLPNSRLRERGVYLITGGLGAIGLALAEELARAVQARLVLLGRTGLPERDAWDGWLASHAGDDPTSQAIGRVRAIEALGAEVLPLRADVTDPAQLHAAVAAAEAHFGAIHGVVHAAGVPGGGMIQLKTRAAAERVLAPKLAGLRALEAALAGARLDFLLLCASTIGVTGGLGQADYSGANAFLDAFAHDYARRGGFAVSIDWSGWREAGMAANTAGLRARHAAPEPLAARPLIAGCLSKTAERAVYQLDLRADEQWLLAEHMVAGVPTLPGTAFLELARAAFEQFAGPGPVELRDVVFLAPLMVPPGERSEAQVVVERAGAGYDFRVVSQAGGRQHEHARGTLAPAAGQPARVDLAALRGTLAPAEPRPAAGADPAALVYWGPRWQSLREVYAGGETALARLELPAAFQADLAHFPLHPALLDVATAFGHQAAGAGLYLPLMYGSVTVRRPLAGQVYSLARYRQAGADDTLTFDVQLLDEHGDELVGIAGFSLRRVDPAALGVSRPAGLAEGMAHEQGVEAFRRILAGCPTPQVVVSPTGVPELVAQARAITQASVLGEIEQSRRGLPAHPRPRMHTAYAAPSTPIEQTIAAIWQAVFGIEQIGVHDNFYELGGDSLLATQAVFRLREAFELDLPLRSLFETPTVAGLAEAIELALLAAASPDELAQALDELELSDGRS